MAGLRMTPYLLLLIAANNAHDNIQGIARDICVQTPDIAWQQPVWLSPGRVCEISFTHDDRARLDDLLQTIQTTYSQVAVDICLVPAADRRKRLLIADMDSTIIRQECIDEIADFAGLKQKISGITERAMRGELPFDAALRERVSLLKGLPANVLQNVIDERIQLTDGARTLVQTMRANGAATALVSGGFTFFTERVAEMTGFAINQANELIIADGRLTGAVGEPILGQDAKRAALHRLMQEHALTADQTLAVGDGANDLVMIKDAGLGVAFHAKPIVAAQADVQIKHGDLTALLYLQGYRDDEFVN
jgi:phosphoserine phosphatase